MARGNGEGSLYFDEKRQRWRGTVTVAAGQRKSVYGKTKKEAVEKMNALKADILNGTYAGKNNETVGGYLRYMIEKEKQKNLIKDNTFIRKIEILKKIEAHPIGAMRIQAVSAVQIEDFLLSLTDYSNSVIVKEYALLKRCFEDNIPALIKVNPMAKIKCPKSNKPTAKQRALTIDEHKKLLEFLPSSRYGRQMLIMLNTGMRMGEINALTADDVNLQFGTVAVRRTITRDAHDIAVIGADTKTEAGARLLPLTNAARELFADALREASVNAYGLIFAEKGKPISTSAVNLAFHRLCDKHGIIDESIPGKVSLHSLRHTYATRCIEAGMSAKVLQELLGHTDIKITMNTYCDAFEQFKTRDIGKVEAYLSEQFG